jgi:NAD+ diphosphatase
MQEYILDVRQDFFRFISRTAAEVVMVVRRPDGGVLLSTKEFYPKGVYRLPTGKLSADEDPEEGFRRELLEETSYEPGVYEKLGTLSYVFHSGDERSVFESHVYLVSEAKGEPKCLDKDEQITGFKWVAASELLSVAKTLRDLLPPWSDWGRFRAVAHEFVVHKLQPPMNADKRG